MADIEEGRGSAISFRNWAPYIIYILVSIRINVRYGADSFDSKCGMSRQRLTEVMDFEEENMRLSSFQSLRLRATANTPLGGASMAKDQIQ